jgi:hypothetical protein
VRTQAARAKLSTRHRTKINRTKKTIQKSKKTTNTDPINKSGVKWGLEKDKQILLLIQIYSVSAETMINDAFSYSENV